MSDIHVIIIHYSVARAKWNLPVWALGFVGLIGAPEIKANIHQKSPICIEDFCLDKVNDNIQRQGQGQGKGKEIRTGIGSYNDSDKDIDKDI